MKLIGAIWKMLSGKKTNIGAIITILSSVLVFAGAKPEEIEAFNYLVELLKNPETASAIGGIVTMLIGLAHKAYKQNKD